MGRVMSGPGLYQKVRSLELELGEGHVRTRSLLENVEFGV